MSKQFISTNSAGAAHGADIYAVDVCKPFTITASGDGSLKLWSNAVSEVDRPRDHCQQLAVHHTGLHHLAVFEDTIDDSGKYQLVASVSFSGEIFFHLITGNGSQVHALPHARLADSAQPAQRLADSAQPAQPANSNRDAYWAVRFSTDPLGESHKFAATQANGTTKIWSFSIPGGLHGAQTEVLFRLHGVLDSQMNSFATALDLSSNNLLATGFQNGDVVLTQLDTCKPVYTFRSFGSKGLKQNSSTVRSVKFSPLGKLLAVASDSGAYGIITLYDTVYGECVGNFTIPSHSSQTATGAYAHDGWIFEIDFNENGESLLSAGYDGKLRVWNVSTRERESTIILNKTDVDNEEISTEDIKPSATGAKFIKKGTRGGAGGDNNDGIVIISLDKGIRWYREAGGI